jgi:hypothetical protein
MSFRSPMAWAVFTTMNMVHLQIKTRLQLSAIILLRSLRNKRVTHSLLVPVNGLLANPWAPEVVEV